MNKTKKICYLGIGTALYVVLSATVKIPLIGHIQTDLGYIAFGAFLVLFGWPAAIIGVLGCLIESLIFSGWVPLGWMAGQLFIGLTCGRWYELTRRNQPVYKEVSRGIFTVLMMFIGIAEIKTGIECYLYSIPFEIKFAKNMVAFIVDMIPMITGMLIGTRIWDRIKKITNN